MQDQLQQLKLRLGQIADLGHASALLEWDQQTYMPPRGAEARAEQVATLQELAHTLFISDETGELLEALAGPVGDLPYDSDEASLVRVTKREFERERKLPPPLVAERARTATLAHAAWEVARAKADFAHFAPHLEKVIDLSVEIAEALGYEDHIYDALLDLFEPQVKTAEVTAIFQEMKAELVPWVAAISERSDRVDDAILKGNFDPAKQWEFGESLLGQMGFEFTRGRQDKSTHPFTTSFSPNDVRLTTRISSEHLASGLFATIHEGGHALYEQGLPLSVERTPLCDGASMGVHESQSRMWENVIGRSRGFWRFFLPQAKDAFPTALEGITLDQFYRAINRVQPGLIRVEADEVTYNLHIFMRFEIEIDLLERKVSVSNLPELWNAKMQEYLGLTPPNDALGVLQDVHWSGALLGYFPTYSLGNLLSVQFFEQAIEEQPEIPDQIARGEFSPLVGWLRERIHRHGAKFTPSELVNRVTGSPISPQPFLRYLKAKYGEIYDL